MNSSFCIFIVGVHACFQVFGSVWSLHDFPACRDRLAELKMTSEVCRWLRHLSKPCQTACGFTWPRFGVEAAVASSRSSLTFVDPAL